MALESATYINQLREDAPSGLDPKSQGDDHLRLIKGALKRSFPNITAAVTVTAAQLNQLSAPGVLVPTGCIMLWHSTAGTIPAGWAQCDGVATLSTGARVPDLRDTFIRAASPTLPVLTRGGTASHNHSVSVAGTAITVAQMPSHTHGTVPISLNISTSLGAGHFSMGNTKTDSVTYTGGGEAHTHTASADAQPHIPPFVALIYIIKL